MQNGDTRISHNNGTPQCGLLVFFDQIVDYYATYTHTSSTIKIEFESFIDQPSYDESFGIRDIYLILDQCPLNCISCDANVCLSCTTGYF